MEEGKVSPDWLIFAFPIFLFGRKRGGSSWGYSWAGAGCGLGVGCGLEEKWPGRMCNRLPQARRTPLLPDLSVLLHSWQPRLGFPLGGSALQLVWWLLKQNHHNTCQLCFLHALWQIFFFFQFLVLLLFVRPGSLWSSLQIWLLSEPGGVGGWEVGWMQPSKYSILHPANSPPSVFVWKGFWHGVSIRGLPSRWESDIYCRNIGRKLWLLNDRMSQLVTSLFSF